MDHILPIIKYFFYYFLIYFLFSLSYIYIIIPYFSYEGFYINFSIEKALLSVLYLLIFSLVVDKREKVSVSLINALVFFSIIPMLVLFSFQNLELEYTFYTTISVLLIILICKLKFNFKLIPINQRYLLIPVLLSSLFVILILLWKNYNYFNLNISQVYEYRRIISDNIPDIIEYIYNILFKGLVPLLFLYYLFYLKNNIKKFLLSLFLLTFYTLIFGLTSHKFFLFLIPSILIIYFIVNNFIRNLNLVFLRLLIILFLTLIFLYIIFGYSDTYVLISSLFLRRVFFVPAMLNFSYFEFFKEHPFIYFTDSKFLPFGYMLDYPYDLDVSHLIGREIFGKTEMGANTGWLGSGYAHMGFLGMLLYAFIISIVLKYLDYISKYLKKEFVILSFFPYIITMFLSSDLKTAFLTHGLVFYLIFMGILAYNEKRRSKNFGH